MLAQKLVTILCANFIILLFPSGEGITKKIGKKNLVLDHDKKIKYG
jgi:hypothetical protein